MGATPRTFLRRLWRRLPHRLGARPFEEVTAEDIYYCYRLLLKREPDPDGWRTWTELAERHLLDLQGLADRFLISDEYRQQQEEACRPRLIELADFKIFVRLNDPFIGAGIARSRTYEPHVTDEVRRRLRRGGVFIDVGANIGYFTLLAASLVGREGRVIAFEPNPDNVALLADSVAANAFTNVEVHPYAAAERAGPCVLEVIGTNSTGTLLESGAPAPPDLRRLDVAGVAIDEVLPTLARVDLVKFDIEGAEPRAWRGMQQLIRTHQPLVLTEFCPELIAQVSRVSPSSYLDQLRAAGYVISVLGPPCPRTLGPLSNEAILDLHARSGISHLDLLATPSPA